MSKDFYLTRYASIINGQNAYYQNDRKHYCYFCEYTVLGTAFIFIKESIHFRRRTRHRAQTVALSLLRTDTYNSYHT